MQSSGALFLHYSPTSPFRAFERTRSIFDEEFSSLPIFVQNKERASFLHQSGTKQTYSRHSGTSITVRSQPESRFVVSGRSESRISVGSQSESRIAVCSQSETLIAVGNQSESNPSISVPADSCYPEQPVRSVYYSSPSSTSPSSTSFPSSTSPSSPSYTSASSPSSTSFPSYTSSSSTSPFSTSPSSTCSRPPSNVSLLTLTNSSRGTVDEGRGTADEGRGTADEGAAPEEEVGPGGKYCTSIFLQGFGGFSALSAPSCEGGLSALSVHSTEDRLSVHSTKADRSSERSKTDEPTGPSSDYSSADSCRSLNLDLRGYSTADLYNSTAQYSTEDVYMSLPAVHHCTEYTAPSTVLPHNYATTSRRPRVSSHVEHEDDNLGHYCTLPLNKSHFRRRKPAPQPPTNRMEAPAPPTNQKAAELENYAMQYEAFKMNRRCRNNSREGDKTASSSNFGPQMSLQGCETPSSSYLSLEMSLLASGSFSKESLERSENKRSTVTANQQSSVIATQRSPVTANPWSPVTIHSLCNKTVNEVQSQDLNGVHSQDLNRVQKKDLNKVQSLDLNRAHTQDLNRVQSRNLEGVQSLYLNGDQSGIFSKAQSEDFNRFNLKDLNGVQSQDLNGVQLGDLNRVQSRDLNGVQSGDLNGVQSRDLNGVKSVDLNGVKSVDLNGVPSRGMNKTLIGVHTEKNVDTRPNELLTAKRILHRVISEDMSRCEEDTVVHNEVQKNDGVQPKEMQSSQSEHSNEVEHQDGVRSEQLTMSRAVPGTQVYCQQSNQKEEKGVQSEDLERQRGVQSKDLERHRGVQSEDLERQRGVQSEGLERQRGVQSEDLERQRGVQSEELERQRGVQPEELRGVHTRVAEVAKQFLSLGSFSTLPRQEGRRRNKVQAFYSALFEKRSEGGEGEKGGHSHQLHNHQLHSGMSSGNYSSGMSSANYSSGMSSGNYSMSLPRASKLSRGHARVRTEAGSYLGDLRTSVDKLIQSFEHKTEMEKQVRNCRKITGRHDGTLIETSLSGHCSIQSASLSTTGVHQSDSLSPPVIDQSSSLSNPSINQSNSLSRTAFHQSDSLSPSVKYQITSISLPSMAISGAPVTNTCTPNTNTCSPTISTRAPLKNTCTNLANHKNTKGNPLQTSRDQLISEGSHPPNKDDHTTSGTAPLASGSAPPTSGTNSPTSGNTTPTSGASTPKRRTSTPTRGTDTPSSGTALQTSGNALPTSGTSPPSSGNMPRTISETCTQVAIEARTYRTNPSCTDPNRLSEEPKRIKVPPVVAPKPGRRPPKQCGTAALHCTAALLPEALFHPAPESCVGEGDWRLAHSSWAGLLMGGTDCYQPPPTPNHQHSDSGLSSLYGSIRTTMTSPVSVISSSSSMSSSSSLRSASSVSCATVDEAIKGYASQTRSTCYPEAARDRNSNVFKSSYDSSASCGKMINHSSNPVPWLVVDHIAEFLGPTYSTAGGDLGVSYSASSGNILYLVKSKVDRLEEDLIRLRYEQEQLTAYFCGLASVLLKSATLAELQKFELHVAEVDKMTSLLASLRYRREQVRRRMDREKDYFERNVLEAKAELLAERLAEAEALQRSIQRRSQAVEAYLTEYITRAEVAEYRSRVAERVRVVAETRRTEHQIQTATRILVLADNLDKLG